MMSRLLLVPCVALLLVHSAWAQNPFADDEAGASQEHDPFAAEPRRQMAANENDARAPSVPTRQTAEDRIEAALNSPLKAPLEYQDQPLNEVLSTLQADFNIPIVFDMSALNEFAISPETEVTGILRNVSLRTALELMLRQPGLEDLTAIVDENVLLITTQERANSTLLTKFYRVDDFSEEVVAWKRRKGDLYSNLVQVIVSCVSYDTWSENGTGEGQIHLLKPGILAVSQAYAVHREIEKLLQDLRAVQAEMEGDFAQVSDK